MYRFKPCTKCGAPALYNKDDEMTEVDRTPVKRVVIRLILSTGTGVGPPVISKDFP